VSAVATTVGTFVWHEQVSSDPARAQAFYGELFGWGTEVFKPGEADYAMIAAGGQMHGGFGKALEGAPPPHWLGHVRVEKLEAAIERAQNAGGRLAAGPFEMSEVGRIAIVRDPQGAYVSLYEPQTEGPRAEGVFVWDELIVPDADAAQRFYEEVFGWRTTDPGPEYGGYRIFQQGEARIGGLMGFEGSPPHWRPYVAVADVDGTVARAKELGATVGLEPMDVPMVGRLAVLGDPQGATFGIIAATPAS